MRVPLDRQILRSALLSIYISDVSARLCGKYEGFYKLRCLVNLKHLTGGLGSESQARVALVDSRHNFIFAKHNYKRPI